MFIGSPNASPSNIRRAADGRFASHEGALPEVALGSFTEPEDWPFDEYEMDMYTSGECYRLARALEQLGVGRLVAIASRNKPDSWVHMLVETADGRYVDIEGIHTAEDVAARWFNWFEAPESGTISPVPDYEEGIRGQGQGACTEEDAQEAAIRLVDACSR